MKQSFFMPMIPPTATAQQKKITQGKNGTPIVRDSDASKEARAKLLAALPEPIQKLAGPVRVATKWIWPLRKADKPGTYYKTTKPDADNMVKLLLDSMTKRGYWTDDSQVASLTVEKFRSDTQTGIYIEAQEMDPSPSAHSATTCPQGTKERPTATGEQ